MTEFSPLCDYPECERCGARTGGDARLCYGVPLLFGLWWVCPNVPHFHITCQENGRYKHPCGHKWLMATHDQPEPRMVYGGGPLNRWF